MIVPCLRADGQRLLDDLRGRLRERREDAAGVEPAHAERAEEVVPVDLAGPHARGGRVAPVADADRAAHAEAALGEVQPVADLPADAVERHPADERRIDAALEDEVFEEPADLVVGEGADEAGAQAEAAAQAARDVVLAAALPDAELARRADAPVAGIEAEHHLAERHQVEAALRRGLDASLAILRTPSIRRTAPPSRRRSPRRSDGADRPQRLDERVIRRS